MHVIAPPGSPMPSFLVNGRYLMEVPGVRKVVANDYDHAAIEIMR